MSEPESTPPRVFISYAHEDGRPEHADRVLDFSNRGEVIDELLSQRPEPTNTTIMIASQ